VATGFGQARVDACKNTEFPQCIFPTKTAFSGGFGWESIKKLGRIADR
jgi:hypothetical protein